jgi:hypothetical protein
MKANESGNLRQSLSYALAITGLSVLADTALADIGDVLLIEDFLISRPNSNSGGGGGCGGGDGGGFGGCGGLRGLKKS